MERFRTQVDEAAAWVGARLEIRPEIGIILGTGLGSVVEGMKRPLMLPYAEIPHCPVSTVTSHHGRFVCGTWAGKPILAMQGRFHLYEGYSPREISFPIRVMRSLGVRTLIVCSAAGGLNPQFRSGDVMLVSDHINLTGQNPLVGPNVDDWGARFSDMTEPYGHRLQKLAMETALAEGVLLHRGVYVGVLGPSMETAAETRFLRTIGADAVGMSMVMEAITAVHAGLEVLGLCAISNVNLPDCYEPAPIERVIATAEQAGLTITRLLAPILERL